MQEQLQRMPVEGDAIAWGGMQWLVILATDEDGLLIEFADAEVNDMGGRS